MSDLFNDDAAAREARLLRAVTLEGQPLGRVADIVCGDGRVVRDLFDYEVGLTASIEIGPKTVEQSASL